ncbi:MAG: type II toxin-antitoxin system HicB family antitoxin, partial [Clostridiales bacterium]
ECLTEGDNMEKAYEMAVDALGLCLTDIVKDKENIPVASTPDSIDIPKDGFLVIVEFDMTAYKRRTNSKAVKKTLSIPQWLNEEATSKGVNFSQVLQEALVLKIHGQ